jgi:hypothetical protein
MGRALILCSSDCATNLSLAEKEFSPSLTDLSGKLIISCSKISKTCFQDLMASVTHGFVSDRTSAFGLESSPDASSFFAAFRGAIILKEIELSYL